MTRAVWLCLLLAPVLLGVGCSDPYASPPPTSPERKASAAKTPVAAIQQQDRVSAEHRASEARAMRTRPLLDQLPISVDGITISIAGLAADGRTTIIAADRGARRSTQHAQRLYHRALRAAGDTGSEYLLEVTR